MIGGDTGRPDEELDRSRHPEPDAPEGARHVPRRADELGEQLLDPGEAALRPGADVRRLVAVAKDATVQIGDRDVDARRTEVADEEVTGIGTEPDAPRRPAAGARACLGVLDEPEAPQLAETLRDDGAAQPGGRHELRAGARAPSADRVEDHDE